MIGEVVVIGPLLNVVCRPVAKKTVDDAKRGENPAVDEIFEILDEILLLHLGRELLHRVITTGINQPAAQQGAKIELRKSFCIK